MGKRCSLWCRRSGDQQPSDTRPDLHDAWQDDPRNGRQSFHSVPTIMPESGSPGKPPDASLLARRRLQLGDLVGADLMHDAAEFLDALAEPGQFLFADLVMFGLCRARNYAERARDARVFR